MKEGNNIEKLFKEGFENYEVDPGDHLWSEIEKEIPVEPVFDAALAGGSAATAGSSWLTTVVIGGAIGLVSVAGYYYFENTAEARKEQNSTEQLDKAQGNRESQFSDSATEGDANNASSNTHKDETGLSHSSSEDAKLSESFENSSSSSNSAFNSSEDLENASTADRSERSRSNSVLNRDKKITKRGSSSDELASKESNRASTSSASSKLNRTDNTSNKSGSNLENKSDNKKVNNKVGSVNNDEISTAANRAKTNRSTTTNGNTVSIPSSNSVDETPGVIELYTAVDVLSPNGDGVNDVFRIDTEKLDPEKVEVKVFNSSDGKLIHEWKEPYGYWDGKLKDGTDAQAGSYFYVITLIKDGKQIVKSGSFTLTRD